MKLRRNYEKPSERRAREKAEPSPPSQAAAQAARPRGLLANGWTTQPKKRARSPQLLPRRIALSAHAPVDELEAALLHRCGIGRHGIGNHQHAGPRPPFCPGTKPNEGSG